jgi:hypothetical protein
MSYEALINTNLNRAFNLVKDLATDVQLTKKTGDSFDFATGASTPVLSSAIYTKAVVTDTEKSSTDRNTTKKLVMLKTEEIGSVSNYDTLQYQNAAWKIGPVIKSTQFITVVEIFKEA